jgi:4-hydroxy-tetrahydrodipicolinate synthase
MNELRGTGVALVTPFDQNYSIDYDGLTSLLKHVRPHVDHLTVMGTTGENPTISFHDQMEILDFVISQSDCPIVLGLSGNDTSAFKSKFKEVGNRKIKAFLIASPYYNRPSQEGINAHYLQLADWAQAPIILYNVPARTASNIEAATTIQLAAHQNIVGIKEASGILNQCRRIIEETPTDFLTLSGDDQYTLDIIKMGGHGVISVLANCLPKETALLVSSALHGNVEAANAMHSELSRCYGLMTSEGNPTSVKTALEVLGICHRRVRLPLVAGSQSLEEEMRLELEQIKKG